MMKKAIIVGGSNGLGKAMAIACLQNGYDKIQIYDKSPCDLSDNRISHTRLDLSDDRLPLLNADSMTDTLIITAGFGRVAQFGSIVDREILNSFKVNAMSAIRIIRQFYPRLNSDRDFKCVIVSSIAGMVSSPMFALYAATKASLHRFIESVNIELEMIGARNRILEVSPGALEGTSFNGAQTDLDKLKNIAQDILARAESGQTLYIPDYDKTYAGVIQRYQQDPHTFGVSSYRYKQDHGRINNVPQVKKGYLSGTFDLFHVGHLNLLQRAKEYCDHLTVGVHKDANHKKKSTFIPFEERKRIVLSIRYVDEIIDAPAEDVDAYEQTKYDYLFVGSDYQGTERFNRYENFFKDTKTKILYFPYTTGTSSTILRSALEKSL